MAQDGVAAFQPLSAVGTAPGGQPALQALTAAASAPGGGPTLKALTASGHAPHGAPSFRALTGSGAASAASVAEGGLYAEFKPLTATGQGSAGSVADGDGEFAPLTATGNTPSYTDIAFKPLVASGVGHTGTVAFGASEFRPLEASGFSRGGSVAIGTAVFQPLAATGVGVGPNVATGSASFLRLRGQGTALVGAVASAAVAFAELEALGVAVTPTVAIGSASFDPLRASGQGSAAIADAYRTWVLNTSNDALTEYQNYRFNSFAELGGAYFAAGPEGIKRLSGVDDDGARIAWSFRTGLLDGKNTMLKRLEEVLLAVRFDGPMRLRVWTDDNSYFEYNVENHRPGVVHQVRSKLGKGTRSRYYQVELAGLGTTSAEVSTMQLPMIPLQRRVG